MKKLTKIGASALAGSLVAFSANAAEMSVSGSAKMTYKNGDTSEVTGNPYGMNTSLGFTGTGDVNGYETTLFVTSADQFGGMSSASVSVNLGDMGMVHFDQGVGKGGISTIDDKTPSAYEEVWALTTGNVLINGIGGNDLWRYDSPELIPGLTVSASYQAASQTGSTNAYTDMGVSYSPEMLEGLTLAYATGEVDESTSETGDDVTGTDESTMWVTYATGPITVGYQQSEADGATATQDDDSTEFGISYAVTEDFSVSYGEHELDLGSSTSDQESEGFSASYTMGGTSIKAAFNETTNVRGAAATDTESYEIALVFAF